MNITSIINEINKRLRALEVNQAKLPSRISSTSGSGGGSGSRILLVDSIDDLPTPYGVSDSREARIIGDNEFRGAVAKVNPAGDGWDLQNFLR